LCCDQICKLIAEGLLFCNQVIILRLTIETFSGEDFEDDDEDLPGNPDPVKPNETTPETRLKQLSKKKKRHRKVQINDSLPKIVREKSKNDVKSRISVSEIRSFSTPDLKLLAAHSSPYISLEDVSPKHVPANCMPPPERYGLLLFHLNWNFLYIFCIACFVILTPQVGFYKRPLFA
jgi:hypothetical protein